MATYQSLYNSALATVKSKCANYGTNFGSLLASFKQGYYFDKASAAGTDGFNRTVYLRFYIANPVIQVNETVINNAFSQTMARYNIRGDVMSKTATGRGLFNFYLAVADFCSTKLAMATNIASSATPIIFVNVDSQPAATITPYEEIVRGAKEVVASDVIAVTKFTTTVINSVNATYPITYTSALTL